MGSAPIGGKTCFRQQSHAVYSCRDGTSPPAHHPEADSMSEFEQTLHEVLGEDFEVLRRIGVGSKSFVYLARERALRRLVAIKVLQPEQAVEEETRKRFAREGRSMARIRQRNVVAVYRVGELPDGLPFMVMEYINGRTLKDSLQARGAFSIDRTTEVLHQVASALEAAHREGIIHRDLRPDNVLEEVETERIVLTDFGLAGLVPTSTVDETRLTVQGQLLGNPQYASPEQLQGEPVTEHTDSYSLGILGYEILTLRLPYDARTNVEMLTAHLNKEPIPLIELRSVVPGELAELLERCLKKRPEERPTSTDIVGRLDRLVNPEEATARTGSSQSEPPNALRAFQEEINRRHVGKVGAAYIVFGFLSIQAAWTLLESFLQDSESALAIYQAVVIAYLAGIPLTLVLAWLYDITSEGIRRTEGGTRTSGPLRTLQFGGLVFSLGIVAALGWWFFGR